VFTLVILYSRNEFEIVPSLDNNHIKQQIIGDDQASTTTLFDVLTINISFTPLYKGVKTLRLKERLKNNLQVPKSAELLSH